MKLKTWSIFGAEEQLRLLSTAFDGTHAIRFRRIQHCYPGSSFHLLLRSIDLLGVSHVRPQKPLLILNPLSADLSVRLTRQPS